MKPSRFSKASLGALTLWSPLSVVITFVWLFRSPLLTSPSAVAEFSESQLILTIVQLLLLALLTLITLIVLSVTTLYYGIHILRNDKLSGGKKVAWSLTNVTVGPFLMPVYWYLYVFSE